MKISVFIISYKKDIKIFKGYKIILYLFHFVHILKFISCIEFNAKL